MEEVERTRQFGKEVVDLLRHQPHFRMSFSKFIPTYHHHFGRQCKLSYYGFTKLVELFEAIPDVLTVGTRLRLQAAVIERPADVRPQSCVVSLSGVGVRRGEDVDPDGGGAY